MKALSATQQSALECALIKLNHDRSGICEMWKKLEDGWFTPQFTQRGSIEFSCRPQTAKSLFNLGLLDNRTVGTQYWDRRAREWRYAVEYRISQKGIEFLKNVPAPLDWQALEEEYGSHG